MDITETNDYYVVSFFPNATEVEIDNKPEKGYKAVIGIQDDEHVVMKVMYAKSMYDLNRVIELAKNIKECPICKRLDANVADVTNIQLQDKYTTRSVSVDQAPIDRTIAVPQESKMFDTGNPFQDLMARMLFDTKLNKAGQVAVAMALEDTKLMEKVMPTTIDGVVDLMATFTELTQGKGDIYRTPEEVTEYVKALRKGADVPVDKKTKSDTPTVFRRASTIIVS